MVAPTILPGRAFSGVNRVSDLLFHWNARNFSLDAITGQTGTFARSSVGGLVQGTGLDHELDTDNQLRLVGPASDGVPRWEWVADENGIYVPALRLEGARTNLATYSQSFANWTLINLTAADATTGPDGGSDMELLTPTFSSGFASMLPAYTGDGDKVASLYIKQGTSTVNTMGIYDITTAAWRHRIVATWTAGVPVLTTAQGSGTLYDVEDVGGGIYRIAWSNDGVVAANTNRFYVYPHLGGTDTLYAWGAQTEDATFPSTYTPTMASAVTRAAESLSWPFNAVPQPMTVYVEFIERGTAGVNNSDVMFVGSSGNLYLAILGNSATGYMGFYDNGPTSRITSFPSGSPSLGNRVELALQLEASGVFTIYQSINGGATTSGTNATGGLALPSAWSAQEISVGGTAGFTSVAVAKAAPGVRTLDYMRSAF